VPGLRANSSNHTRDEAGVNNTQRTWVSSMWLLDVLHSACGCQPAWQYASGDAPPPKLIGWSSCGPC
jgi:hypothetical protein